MFPIELTSRKQWLLWSFEQYEGDKKPRKVPYYINGKKRTGTQGSPEDLAQLATYQQAKNALEFGDYSGLGFAFLPNDGLIGIDIDHNEHRDPQLAQKIITGLNTYTELSPSGKGYHLFVLGNTKTFKNNDIGIEVFSNSQFFTMTGNQIEGTPNEVNQISEKALNRLREIVKPTRENKPKTESPLPINDRAKIESALAYIPADCGYDDWWKIGAAIYSEFGASGFSIWDYWSAKSSKYSPRGMNDKYNSFANIHDIKIATVYRMAIDNGWQPPKDPNFKPQEQVTPPPQAQTQPQGIDVFTPLIDITPKGKPLSTIENMQEILNRIGVIARYNVINKQIELLIPDAKFSIDNQANAALAHVLSWVNRFGMSTGNVQDFVTAIADQNQYNPVANWILSKQWDKKPRLTEFWATIKEKEATVLKDGRQLKDVLLMRWMVSCIAAVFNPDGISAHGVLVLQGDQYLGKTKWMKSLAPKELGVIKDGITLNPSDKDSVMQCVRNWIVELGELDATFRKSDIASLKSFITSDRDVLRRPYARLESEFARRTVFFASVNPKQFLHDPTGNRRFWTIECDYIDHSHDFDMQQVWAEVYEQLYKKDVKCYLEPEEMAALNNRNESHTSDEPIKDLIDTAFNWLAPASAWNYKSTATDICILAGMLKPTKADINSASQHVEKKYKVQTKYNNGRKVWMMPPKLNQYTQDPAFGD